MAGIYLHIPFCRQACSYCDFYFITRTKRIGEFVDQLVADIESSNGWHEPIATIYFGGGTPSLLSPQQLDRILTALQQRFDCSQVQETTLECNPENITKDYLQDVAALGIDRLSMGVQSFNEKLLKFMHRVHSREEALTAMELVKAFGPKNFTFDLIYGNPGQSLDMLDDDITTMLGFEPPHVSAYALTIEPKTRLGKQAELGRLEAADDDIVNQHFDLIGERLSDAGIQRYEVSNYAIPGFEAAHNSNYWRHHSYFGFGPGAHSLLWQVDGNSAMRIENGEFTSKTGSGVRRDQHSGDGNDSDPSGLQDLWLTGLNQGLGEVLNLSTLADEYILMRLRTLEGLDLQLLESRYNLVLNASQRGFVADLEKRGLANSDDTLKLTTEGLKLADRIALEIVSRG